MLTLDRVSRALDSVRSGRVIVNEAALNRLCSIYIDVHSTELFTENDLDLIQQIEAKGQLNGTRSGRDSRASRH